MSLLSLYSELGFSFSILSYLRIEETLYPITTAHIQVLKNCLILLLPCFILQQQQQQYRLIFQCNTYYYTRLLKLGTLITVMLTLEPNILIVSVSVVMKVVDDSSSSFSVFWYHLMLVVTFDEL